MCVYHQHTQSGHSSTMGRVFFAILCLSGEKQAGLRLERVHSSDPGMVPLDDLRLVFPHFQMRMPKTGIFYKGFYYLLSSRDLFLGEFSLQDNLQRAHLCL